MKKAITMCILCAVLCGCSTSESSVKPSETVEPSSETDDSAYEAYASAWADKTTEETYTVSAVSRYDLRFSDNSLITYELDSVLEADESKNTAHLSQHINSNGASSAIDGYLYNGRLYNTYNGINYYEDMSLEELKATLIVPVEPKIYEQSDIASVTSEEKNGNTVYTVILNDTCSAKIMSQRYDVYSLNEMDGFSVSSAKIENAYDKDGHFVRELAEFEVEVKYGTETISVTVISDVTYLNVDNTDVEITDEMMNEHAEYVSFNDIDLDNIDTSDVPDDSPEATVTETFRKRVVSRLGYEEQSNGTMKTIFNENEAYTVDFDNCLFEYSNYSITYSYSWKNNVASMGACTYAFDSAAGSDSCADSTIETMNDVKSYLEMELYYCGLSLEDLQAEAK